MVVYNNGKLVKLIKKHKNKDIHQYIENKQVYKMVN